MKRIVFFLLLVLISSSVYADKYLYLTRYSKPLKLTDGDFRILCDNSICYINGSEEEKKVAGKKLYDFINACFMVTEERMKWSENELLLPDELIEIDILSGSPIKIIRNITIFRDDTVGELVLKTIGKEKITIVNPDNFYDINKIPIFGRKVDYLVLHRGIWELQTGTFLIGWLAMPYMVNEGNYDVPDWWK